MVNLYEKNQKILKKPIDKGKLLCYNRLAIK